jgi:predicted nuclease with TOPRIM domain
MGEIVEQLRMDYSEIEQLRAEVARFKGENSRLDLLLDEDKAEIERLRQALSTLVADWEAVPDNVQVPDEINVNEHWDAARVALQMTL